MSNTTRTEVQRIDPFAASAVPPDQLGRIIGGNSGKSHRVEEGDNLSTIAKKNGTSVNKLLENNPLLKKPDLIHPGQALQIEPGTVHKRSGNNE